MSGEGASVADPIRIVTTETVLRRVLLRLLAPARVEEVLAEVTAEPKAPRIPDPRLRAIAAADVARKR